MFFYLMSFANSRFILHSPDEIIDKNIETLPLNLGVPSLYPIYGFLHPIYSEACESDHYGSNEAFIIVLNPSNCNITELAEKAYRAGTKLIMLVDNGERTLTKSIVEKGLYSDLTDIIMIIVSDDFRLIFENYNFITASYVYDYNKTLNPKVRVILSGIHNEDKLLIDNFSNFFKKYEVSAKDIEFNFIYKFGSSPSLDCIYFSSKYYCSWNSSSYTGQEILSNLILSQTYYNTISKSYESFSTFLNYLLSYYSKCFENYTLLCHLQVFLNLPSNPFLPDNTTLYSALEYKTFRSFYSINNVSIPWINYIEEVYCISSLHPNSKCPLCSPGCTHENLNSNICNVFCNNSACGYQNLECLLISPGCYNFMLEDSLCNQACNEHNCYSNMTIPDTDSKSHNHKNVIKNMPFIVISYVIFITLGLILLLIITKKLISRAYLKQRSIVPQVNPHSYKFFEVMSLVEENICPIDLDDFREDDDVVLTFCCHVFHTKCYRDWVEKSLCEEKSCPICRQTLRAAEIIRTSE